jgi:F0F1-type ATP synthase assembly protein I
VAKKPWPVLVGEYTSLAFLLPTCVLVGYGAGYLLDRHFGTKWMEIAGLMVGIAAGLYELVRHVMRDSQDGE